MSLIIGEKEPLIFDPKNEYGQSLEISNMGWDFKAIYDAMGVLKNSYEQVIPLEYRHNVKLIISDPPKDVIGHDYGSVCWKYSPKKEENL